MSCFKLQSLRLLLSVWNKWISFLFSSFASHNTQCPIESSPSKVTSLPLYELKDYIPYNEIMTFSGIGKRGSSQVPATTTGLRNNQDTLLFHSSRPHSNFLDLSMSVICLNMDRFNHSIMGISVFVFNLDYGRPG